MSSYEHRQDQGMTRQGALRLGQPGMTDISVAVRLADAA